LVNQSIEIVVRICEDVVELVGIVHISRALHHPFGNPRTRSPMMLR
jgi:hypothetical protein